MIRFLRLQLAIILLGLPISALAAGTPVEYINQIFQFAITIAGLLAVGSIVYAGFRYASSGGNSAIQSDAKDRIWQAIIGLILLFTSGMILRSINSTFGELTLAGLTALPETQSVVCSMSCPQNSFCVIKNGVESCQSCTKDCGKQACVMEPDGTMECKSCDPVTQAQCDKQGKTCVLGVGGFQCQAKECGQEFGSCCPGQLSCDKVCHLYPGTGGGGSGSYKCDPISADSTPPPRPIPNQSSTLKGVRTEWWCSGKEKVCMEAFNDSKPDAGCKIGEIVQLTQTCQN